MIDIIFSLTLFAFYMLAVGYIRGTTITESARQPKSIPLFTHNRKKQKWIARTNSNYFDYWLQIKNMFDEIEGEVTA